MLVINFLALFGCRSCGPVGLNTSLANLINKVNNNGAKESGKQAWKKFCSRLQAAAQPPLSNGHYLRSSQRGNMTKMLWKSTVLKAPGNSGCERRWNFYLACWKIWITLADNSLMLAQGNWVTLQSSLVDLKRFSNDQPAILLLLLSVLRQNTIFWNTPCMYIIYF